MKTVQNISAVLVLLLLIAITLETVAALIRRRNHVVEYRTVPPIPQP